MSAPLSKDLVATVLVEALYSTDEMACNRYGISLKSLQRYRQSLPDDPELAGIVATKKNYLDEAWAQQIPVVLSKSLQAIKQSMEAMMGDSEKMKDPQVLQALVGAHKICAEVQITSRMIDARIGKPDNQASGLPRPSDPQNPPIERPN